MVVEIKSVEISEEAVVLEGINLETILTSDDLYEEIDEEVVRFKFENRNNSQSARKYLYKVCQGNKSAAREKSLGAKLEKLVGQIISLSESFIEKE